MSAYPSAPYGGEQMPPPGSMPPPGYPGAMPAGYPPPGSSPAAYPPGAIANTPPVVVYTQAAPPQVKFRDLPVPCTCPHCHAQITTKVRFETGGMAWLIAGGLCLIGCWLGCCMIPFCVDAAKDVIHVCPQCNQVIGKFDRLNS